MGVRFENILAVHDYVKELLGDKSDCYDIKGIADEISDFDGLGYLTIREEYTDENKFKSLAMRYRYPYVHFRF